VGDWQNGSEALNTIKESHKRWESA
jgi:inorganic pyrophosphatase